jgi:ACS family hexuronate transporter-like MFS transporter
MTRELFDPGRSPRGSAWKWSVCGLLLLATMINYMDRLTLNLAAKRIKDELTLSNEQYGQVEAAFGVAFACGALLAGWCADRWNVRWLYPLALLGWSAAGFATGFANSFAVLMLCRFALGLFEAGHWPCALRTTQRILPPHERTLGNSLLQSGAALGAIVTPLVVQALLTDEPDSWRYPFFVVGAAGTIWVVFWLGLVRTDDLELPRSEPAKSAFDPSVASARDRYSADAAEPESSLRAILRIYADRRFWVLIVLVVTINLTWHFFRVWMPLFLREQHGYSEEFTNYFISGYYIATDAGTLTAGFLTLFLARYLSVHASRVVVFATCALITSISVAVGFLPAGPLLLGLLLLLGFAALGLFPPYYSLSQELTVRHQGKVSGSLGFTTWMASAIMHPMVGYWLDWTKQYSGSADYSRPVALAGLFPLLGLTALLLLWRQPTAPKTGPSEAIPANPPEESRAEAQ